jgi:predicted TIM-barrel fold metal-dependent hydrolase
VSLDPDFRLIDGHAHLFSTDGWDHIRIVQDRIGAEATNLACLPAWKKEFLAQNLLGLACKAAYPGRIYCYGGLGYFPAGRSDFADQARRLFEAGCDGIKMLEGKPDTRRETGPLDASRYDAFYDFLQSGARPILFHVADPESYWDPAGISEWARQRGWFWGDGRFPGREQLYGEVDRVLARFPRLRVVLAHFYFLSADPDRLSRLLDRAEGVALDMAPGTTIYVHISNDPARWRAFFARYQDRILLGTDSFLAGVPRNEEEIAAAVRHVQTIRRFLETDDRFEAWNGKRLRGLALDRPVLEKIYRTNFQRYAGVRPAPVRRDLVRRLGEEILEAARSADADDEVAETVRRCLARLSPGA